MRHTVTAVKLSDQIIAGVQSMFVMFAISDQIIAANVCKPWSLTTSTPGPRQASYHQLSLTLWTECAQYMLYVTIQSARNTCYMLQNEVRAILVICYNMECAQYSYMLQYGVRAIHVICYNMECAQYLLYVTTQSARNTCYMLQYEVRAIQLGDEIS